MKEVWTIGHSTRSVEDFLGLLQQNRIELLADVRHFPGSRKYPHFNKDQMEQWVVAAGLEYIHFPGLGGRRKPLENSVNTAWRHAAFRGYADHMATEEFRSQFGQLEELASKRPLAFMCSEAVWWRCHRSLIADLFKIQGWKVLHIMDKGKTSEHPYTGAAKVDGGRLLYSE